MISVVFYKRLVSITNVLWAYTWKLFIPLLTILGLSQGYLLYKNFTNASFENLYDQSRYGLKLNPDMELKPWSLRFEEYLAKSHVNDIFLLVLIITIVILASISLRQKLASKAEYTYLRLPISNYSLFFANVLYAISILAILFAFQLIIILMGYQMYLYFVPEEAVMTQGLFLAFVRWDFLNKFFPIIYPFKIITNILMLFHVGILITYTNMMVLLRSNRRTTIIVGLFPFLINSYEGIGGFIFVTVVVVIIDLWMLLTYPLMLKEVEKEEKNDG